MFRKICILIISLFALSSCGYTSIYSEQKYYDFSISNLELIGNSQNNHPKELNDLSEDYPDVVKNLESLMKSAHTKATIEKFNIPVLDQY